MTINEADRIVHIWGMYLEYCQDKLNAVFLSSIPSSFLPYPPETLKQALNIMINNYNDKGEYDNSDLLRKTLHLFVCYIEDEEALQSAAKVLNMPDWRKTISSDLKRVQEKWIETLKA